MSKQTKPRKAAYRHLYAANKEVDRLRALVLVHFEKWQIEKEEVALLLKQNKIQQDNVTRLNRTIANDNTNYETLRRISDHREQVIDGQDIAIKDLANQCTVHAENAKQLEQWWNDEKRRNGALIETNKSLEHNLETSYRRECEANKTITDLREQVRVLKGAIVQQALRFED